MFGIATLIQLSSLNNIPIIGLMPLLSNFRVLDSNSDRIYFDTRVSVNTITLGAGTITISSGQTVSSVVVNSGNSTGHYLLLNSNITFWDNPTIRATTDSFIIDSIDYRILHLEYVENNVEQPSTSYSQEFYVTTAGSNSNNGLTEGTAFLTLTYALSQVSTNNWIIHVKAGTYSGESISSAANGYQGTITTGGIIQGYKTTPGDLNGGKLPFNYGESLNSSEYPVFDGGNRSSVDFFEVYTDNYRIFRNLAVTNYRKGIYGDSTTARAGQIIESCIFMNLGDITDTGVGSSNGLAVSLRSNTNSVSKSRIKNCVGINATFETFAIAGNENSIINTEAYCNEVTGTDSSFGTTDYYFVMNGSNNIMYGCYSYRDLLTGHYGHTYDFKGLVGACEYNLVQNCEAVNIYDCFGANFTTAKYNVFKDNISRANVSNRPNSDVASAGLRWGNGASYNIWINHEAHNVDQAISIQYNGEDSLGEADIASNNIVINSKFYNSKACVYINTTSGATSTLTNNIIENCTFHNFDYLFNIVDNVPTLTIGSSNIFRGCIFSDITTKNQLYSGDAWTFEENAYFNSTWRPTIVAPSIEEDPQFINTSTGNLEPQNANYIAYPATTNNYYDINRDRRDATTTYGYIMHSNEVFVSDPVETTPPPFDPGLFTNGDFESDASGWSAKDGVISHETSSPLVGSGSLRFDNSTGNSNGGPYQDIGLSTANTYDISGKIKIVSGSTGTLRIYSISSAGFSQTLLYTGPSLPVGSEIDFSTTLTPTDAADTAIEIACGASSSIFLLDNLTITQN